MHRRELLGAAGVSVLAGLTGCQGGVLTGENNEENTVKIGFVVPTSGAFADAGETMTDALSMATDKFDGETDGREIETFVRDSGTNPDTGVPAANELIRNEDIDILIGGFSSSVILPMQEAAAREEIMYFPVGGGATSITGSDCNKYTFAAHSNGYQFVGAPLTAYDKGLFESMHVVAADYPAGRATTDAVNTLLADQRGADVLGTSTFNIGNQDFSAQISDAQNSGADVAYFISAASDAIRFLSQGISAGLKDEMDIFFVTGGSLIANAIEPAQLDGVYAGTHFHWETEDSVDWADSFRDEYNSLPDWFTAPSYDAAMEALTAVDETGSTDPDDMIPFLEGREFSWTRPCEWRECDHRAIQPFYLLEGKAADERENETDYYEVLGSSGGEEIMRSCAETDCSIS